MSAKSLLLKSIVMAFYGACFVSITQRKDVMEVRRVFKTSRISFHTQTSTKQAFPSVFSVFNQTRAKYGMF